MPVTAEVDLYAPVKVLLESQGYVVKGEITGCDVVGLRGSEPPVVVELKRAFNLALVLQGVDRLSLTDVVYLAVGTSPTRPAAVRRLCRRLGLGLIVVESVGRPRSSSIRCPTDPARPGRGRRGCSGSTSDASVTPPPVAPCGGPS